MKRAHKLNNPIHRIRRRRSLTPPRDDSMTMKLRPSLCPICGEPAKGTCELLYGIAIFGHVEHGCTFYEGDTEVLWDEQKTHTENGKSWLICDQGHTWLSRITHI